jgi:hypothetical protein
MSAELSIVRSRAMIVPMSTRTCLIPYLDITNAPASGDTRPPGAPAIGGGPGGGSCTCPPRPPLRKGGSQSLSRAHLERHDCPDRLAL